MSDFDVRDIRLAVQLSAAEQLCPEDMVDDVWEIVKVFEFPESQHQLDSDVAYALRALGLNK